MGISQEVILGERLRRHCLTQPLSTAEGYHELFRLLQPVSTIAFTRPGDPPRLVGSSEKIRRLRRRRWLSAVDGWMRKRGKDCPRLYRHVF